jgi:ADP-ribose pyrophosphatase YjhB (NUDIX family)
LGKNGIQEDVSMSGVFRVRASGIITRDDRILLIDCFDTFIGRHYNIPGGGVNQNEPVLDAVRRELREETGFEVKVGRLMLVCEALHENATTPDEEFHSFSLMFECQIIPGSAHHEPSQPDDYQTDIQWVPIESLPQIVLLPDIGKDLYAVLRGEQTTLPGLARHTYVPGKPL